MKISRSFPSLRMYFAVCALAAGSLFAAETGDGFEPLCNGRDLSGWKNPYGWGKAEVVIGEVHLTGYIKFFLVME